MDTLSKLQATLNNVGEVIELNAQFSEALLVQKVEVEGFFAQIEKMRKDLAEHHALDNLEAGQEIVERCQQLSSYFQALMSERHQLMDQWTALQLAFAASESQEASLVGAMQYVLRQLRKPIYNEEMFSNTNPSFVKFMEQLHV